jgi:hypothetical protein
LECSVEVCLDGGVNNTGRSGFDADGDHGDHDGTEDGEEGC